MRLVIALFEQYEWKIKSSVVSPSDFIEVLIELALQGELCTHISPIYLAVNV